MMDIEKNKNPEKRLLAYFAALANGEKKKAVKKKEE